MASRKEIEENLGDDSENLYGYIKAGLKFGLMGFTFFSKKIDTSWIINHKNMICKWHGGMNADMNGDMVNS